MAENKTVVWQILSVDDEIVEHCERLWGVHTPQLKDLGNVATENVLELVSRQFTRML